MMLKPSDNQSATSGTPLSNLSAERAIVGSVLLNPSIIDDLIDFRVSTLVLPVHRDTMDIAKRLHTDGKHVSVNSVLCFLDQASAPNPGQTVGDYLNSLLAASVAPSDIGTYVSLVSDAAGKRRLHDDAMAAAKAVLQPGADLGSIATTLATNAADAAVQFGDEARFGRRAGDFGSLLIQGVGKPETQGVFRLGLADVEAKLGPVLGGQVIAVGAETGAGKSLIGGLAAIRTAENGGGVAFLSQEMQGVEMAERFFSTLSLSTSEPLAAVDIRKTGEEDLARLRHLELLRKKLDELPIFINEKPGLTIAEVAATVKYAAKAVGQKIDLVVVDYLGLLSADARYRGHKTNEIAELSTSLKRLAKSTGAVFLVLHQFSRNPSNRDSGRPRISDFKDSSQVEQDADRVILLFNESAKIEIELDELKNAVDKSSKERRSQLQERLQEVRGLVEINVAKNRHGPRFKVTVQMSPQYFSMSSLARHSPSEGR